MEASLIVHRRIDVCLDFFFFFSPGVLREKEKGSSRTYVWVSRIGSRIHSFSINDLISTPFVARVTTYFRTLFSESVAA